MKKYKFIITLDEYIQVDSAEEIEGHVSWPNYSQAGPVRYRGIFDSYEEAEKYASEFSLYKYVMSDGYDSYENGDEEYPYFISIYDAEDAVCAFMGVEPGTSFCTCPDDYVIEEVEEDPENDIPAGAYKYCYLYEGERVHDSFEDAGDYYDSYDEAREAAESYMGDYEIETGEYPCDCLYPIEPESVEIVEFDPEEDQ